jgi:hypothetical protein
MSQEVVEPTDLEEICRPIKYFYDGQRMPVHMRKRDIKGCSRRRAR